jgi:hypothetical protein
LAGNEQAPPVRRIEPLFSGVSHIRRIPAGAEAGKRLLISRRTGFGARKDIVFPRVFPSAEKVIAKK